MVCSVSGFDIEGRWGNLHGVCASARWHLLLNERLIPLRGTRYPVVVEQDACATRPAAFVIAQFPIYLLVVALDTVADIR